MAGLNKYSTIPLYCQLKNIILEQIENGYFEEDSKIPSEQDFCEKYNISRPTVRQAINELTNNGHLYKLRGKGTFVSKRKSSIHIKDYTGFTDSILDSLDPENKEIISVVTVSSDEFTKLKEVFNVKSEKSYFHPLHILINAMRKHFQLMFLIFRYPYSQIWGRYKKKNLHLKF